VITAIDIQKLIEVAIVCESLSVSGDDGQHFEAVIVSSSFEGLSRVQRHQCVYAALGDRMRAQIHALSMKTLTPKEAALTA